MYFREHGVPHFHATYGEYRASFAITTLEMLEGDLPRRARVNVLEWASDHRAELHFLVVHFQRGGFDQFNERMLRVRPAGTLTQ